MARAEASNPTRKRKQPDAQERWRRLVVRSWRSTTDDLVTMGQLLHEQGGDIIARAATMALKADSYPTSVTGSGNPGGGSGAGDPVGGAIVAFSQLVEGDRARDPIGAAAIEMCLHLADALRALRRADEARHKAAWVPAVDSYEKEAPVCVNCLRFEVKTPASKAGRCNACYQYRRRHNGRDAPKGIVLSRPGNATPRQLERLAAEGAIPPESSADPRTVFPGTGKRV